MSQPQQVTGGAKKTVTSKISIPINSLSSSSSTSLSAPLNSNSDSHQQITNTMTTTTKIHINGTTTNTTNMPPAINTEEFAKLDALLEDLLAEVEQPILLSKDVHTMPVNGHSLNRINSYNDSLFKESVSANPGHNKENNYRFNSSNMSKKVSSTDDIERSVDWLNEQKERLRSRKELINNYSSKHTTSLANKLADNQNSLVVNENEVNDLNESQSSANNQAYRKIKSKLDFYVTNSNNSSQPTQKFNNTIPVKQSKYGFSYTTNPDCYNGDLSINSGLDCLNQSESEQFNTAQYVVNNKPPLSPSNRQLYSPTNLQQPTQTMTASFRSLSTNPVLLRNINETVDDEMHHQNLADSEFDRYSQRSFRSNTSTVQRSKYHTVSNDFVHCTRPAAPTPVPTPYSTTTKSGYQSKRALSAPPTEIGKVVLQRMELKSPLTVRQGSVVPFEKQQQIIHYPNNEHLIHRVQTPIVNGTLSNRSYVDTSNGGRNIIKLNNNSTLMHQPQQVQVPTRNVFLNRAYSETPRVGYTNGYETDSGLVNGNSYNYRAPNSYGTVSRAYNKTNTQFIDSDGESVRSNTYTRPIVNGYRTICQSGPARYQVINDPTGYETDSGLIKLRQVLDSRRSVSRNNVPIQSQAPQQVLISSNGNVGAGYYYQNRSTTPSFNYTYNQQQSQQPYRIANQYSSHMNMNTPLNEAHFTNVSQDQLTPQFINVQNYPNEALIQTVDGQFIDNNGNEFMQYNNNGIIETIDGFITQDGNPVLFNDVDPHLNIENTVITYRDEPNNNNSTNQQIIINGNKNINNNLDHQPTSLIIQQKVAPSAYQQSDQSAFQKSNNRETPSRLISTSSASNISSQQQNGNNTVSQLNGQLSTSQQLIRSDSRRSSTNSLTEQNEIMRNHPKSVKQTQNYWYKPKISRDEAISLLKDKPAGTFLIRDSNNFPGAYGLALKVDKPPQNVQIKPGADPSNELVRHFLIEPTTKGVKIKGCYNEPVFASLAALVFQHSLTPLALPIKLILPVNDLTATENQPLQQKKSISSSSNSKQNTSHQPQDGRQLLEKGAACNVYFLASVNTENKSGLEAISQALSTNKAFTGKDTSQLLLIQFKVTSQGITLTDINKKKFLRQHFPTNTVTYCAIEEKLTWPTKLEKIAKPRIFGVITKSRLNSNNNECHLFVEIDPDQPAIAIVDFINRYLIPSKYGLKN